MRGAERPMGIRWSRPFIQPLETLNRRAAKECFLDIVDNMEDDSQLDALLDLTDNVPLAVRTPLKIHYLLSVPNRLLSWRISLPTKERNLFSAAGVMKPHQYCRKVWTREAILINQSRYPSPVPGLHPCLTPSNFSVFCRCYLMAFQKGY
jgi:hypothetical protein